MEHAWKIIIITFAASISLGMRAAIVVPDDVTNIELLISAHKQMAKAELAARNSLALIEEEHRGTNKVVANYNLTRSVLNKRLSDVNSYLSLALQLATVANKCKNLVDNYTDFTTTIYSYALKKPFVMAYYTRANYELKREIKRISEMVASYAASNVGVLKATMKEKYMMLSNIDACVSRMNWTLNHNALMCRSLIDFGLKMYHVSEFIGSTSTKDMAQELADKWKINAAKYSSH